jgi:hypothetical protein
VIAAVKALEAAAHSAKASERLHGELDRAFLGSTVQRVGKDAGRMFSMMLIATPLVDVPRTVARPAAI